MRLMAYFCALVWPSLFLLFFFFNDTATTEIYTLSLHDALPISGDRCRAWRRAGGSLLIPAGEGHPRWLAHREKVRSEEHTSELQSLAYLVCRLLLEKKKKQEKTNSSANVE